MDGRIRGSSTLLQGRFVRAEHFTTRRRTRRHGAIMLESITFKDAGGFLLRIP